MLYIHKSELPKRIQQKLKHEPEWLEGSVLFFEHSARADFIDKNGKVLFQFTRPVVIAHSAIIIRYAACVFTGVDNVGTMVGEFCELNFHLKSPQT